jgi:nucleoid DNA-binding protein
MAAVATCPTVNSLLLATGEAIKIPAKMVVKFRLAKAFKEAVVPPKKK